MMLWRLWWMLIRMFQCSETLPEVTLSSPNPRKQNFNRIRIFLIHFCPALLTCIISCHQDNSKIRIRKVKIVMMLMRVVCILICMVWTSSCGFRLALRERPPWMNKRRGVLSHIRESVIEPPSYDPRNIVDLIDKYRDAHISDSGWREVDPEEWFADNWKIYWLLSIM